MRQRALVVAFAVLLIRRRRGQADPSGDVTRPRTLAKVWGLLKYFHPASHQGSIDWDAGLVDENPSNRVYRSIRTPSTRNSFASSLGRLAAVGPSGCANRSAGN